MLPTKSEFQDNVSVRVIVVGVHCIGDGSILVPFPLHGARVVMLLSLTALLFLDVTPVRTFNMSRSTSVFLAFLNRMVAVSLAIRLAVAKGRSRWNAAPLWK